MIFILDFFEFQNIFMDSKFKADTELNFLAYLQDCPNVTYLSATPYIEEYLDELDEFKNLPYYELKWHPDRLQTIKIDPKKVFRPNQEIDRIIEENKNRIILLDWLLLPKTKFFFQSDFRILVKAPLDIRMERSTKRDNITKQKFLERELSAPNIDESQFEYIIENIDLEQTQERVKNIYDKSIIHR